MNVLVKSGDRYFFRLEGISLYSVEKILIDGEELKESFLKGWYISKNRPEILKKIIKKSFLKEYKLKDKYKHLNLEEIRDPESFKDEDDENSNEVYFYDAIYGETFEEEYTELKFDDEIEDKVEKPFTFAVNYKDLYRNDKIKIITGSPSLTHAALFPEITLASKPTSITGDEFYEIIRHHVKENYNPKFATITSDYDFCFTVKKRLAIEPITKILDGRTGRQKKPRPYKIVTDSREVEIFEMTPSSKKYNNYTPIKGIVAKDHKDLKRRINNFLDNLMNIINEPLESCNACNGYGVKKIESIDSEKLLNGKN